MDPFDRIPMEIRLEILFAVRTKESMRALIRASPALFRPYLSVKTRIMRSLVAVDLDDEFTQHAVAIVQFPARNRLARNHLADWHNRQLPNPLQGQYPEIFERVNKLHSRILLFIQDYITKATSRFPPRDYLCLPQIRAPTGTGHSVFRGRKVTTMFRTDLLTDSERKRLLKAFLIYELNCKSIKAGIIPRVPRNGVPLDVPNVLVPLSEGDALQCIHTYFCSLHGAIFAQCGDAWLPEPPNESSLEPGLLFPDSFYLDPNTYMSDLGVPQTRSGELAAEFSKFGLDLVVELLGYDISDPEQKESLLVRLEEFWNSDTRDQRYRHLIHRVSPDMVDEAPMYRQLNPQLRSWSNLQRKIFEQRAWVFFDDARLYPNRGISSHFPSAEFLEGEPDKLVWFQGWEHNSARIRALCRSQEWHDEYKEKSKEDQ
ncbi:hypothetical protein FGADI_2322 [Fusarium gaditjirri]|uniref:Uncharacterized protein n=1 Tax=Fusarium gaditjirri TaxID=282569 RepID=A0A8H4TIH7_9HYPO|nr:hypothetical protein FGADI_2322 [Fusarium gaditjirri]